MKIKLKQIIVVCVFAIGTLIFSGQSANAQFLSKAVFARQFVNGDAQDVKVSFSPKDKVVYCVIGLVDPAPSAVFKFVWKSNQAEVYQQEITNQNGKIIASKFSSPKGLTEGHYEVDLFINGRVRKHLRFPVVKE